MVIKAQKVIRSIIEIEMENPDAETLCADIFYLLECTKDLAGIVPGGSVLAADDCRKRLSNFMTQVKAQI